MKEAANRSGLSDSEPEPTRSGVYKKEPMAVPTKVAPMMTSTSIPAITEASLFFAPTARDPRTEDFIELAICQSSARAW
jgi:hypothetical protein